MPEIAFRDEDRLDSSFRILQPTSSPLPADEVSSQSRAPSARGLDALLPPGLQRDLTELQQRKVQADREITGQNIGRLEADRARMERLGAATGVTPGEMEPWDQDKQREKFRTDPVRAIGSLGFVFAAVASAFTRQPALNAMNGMAAALNAVKDGDDKEFDRAFAAWKENNNLALKRHQVMEDQYRNAAQMFSTDMTLGTAKMNAAAAQFGDRAMQLYMENGMFPEAFDLLDKRTKAAEGVRQYTLNTTQNTLRTESFKQATQQIDADENIDSFRKAGLKLMAFNRAFGVKQTPQQEAMGQFFAFNPAASPEEAAAYYQSLLRPTATNVLEQEIQRQKYEFMRPPEEGGLGLPETEADTRARQNVATARKPASPQETEIQRQKHELMKPKEEGGEGLDETAADTKARKNVTAAGQKPGVATPGRLEAAEIERRAADKMKPISEGGKGYDRTKAFDEATKEVKQVTSSTITANRADQLKSQIDRFSYASTQIDKAEALLKKYNALTGLGGKITRPGEVVGNWFGSNQTDRKQFERYIAELQEWGPRLLNESQGRPLSAEEKRISTIVPGLNLGDTTANTARGLLELQGLFRTMQDQMVKRLKNEWIPPPSGGVALPPAGGDRWWEKLPEVRGTP